MPAHSKTTMAGQLNAARLAISNTLSDPEIQHAVAQFGYTTEKLQEGSRLYDVALISVNTQTIAAGAQKQATAQAELAEQRARVSYQALAQVARAVFVREPARRATLGLIGTAPQGTPAFLAACEQLFGNAINVAEIKGVLGEYGYTEARFEAERAVIDAFDRAYKAQVAAKGAAQHATRAQRDALTRLNQWVAQYLKIARVALHDKPDLIEKLGKVTRNAKTAGQRGAPQKAAATRAARKLQPVPTVIAAMGD